MKLDISNLFNSADSIIEIDYQLDMADLPYGPYFPLKNGARLCGSAYCRADVVHLSAQISFDFFGVCDRCAEEIKKPMSFSVEKILVKALAHGDYHDDYVVLPDGVLNIDEFVREEILLFLPAKILCSDDCKGLCAKCGKNLNHGECACKKEINPAMAPLLQLLQEE
ncbi:MAG: DUF177 domain-containing protein [Clostridiales bacterium]|nr:DUF177 domain-containing protein [Clostridiales bacterium]